MPQMRCSVCGAISDERVKQLTTRLKSLCDGSPAAPEIVDYHEQQFTAQKATKNGGACMLSIKHHRNGNSELSYDGDAAATQDAKDKFCTTLQVTKAQGKPEMAAFVQGLGFELSHEFCRRGSSFTFQRDIGITVTQIFKVTTPGAAADENAVAVSPGYLVEVYGMGSDRAESVDALRARIRDMAEQLQPLVLLSSWTQISI